MTMQTVDFQFITGLKREIFRNARLRGSWDGNGRYAGFWTDSPMEEKVGADGCPVFEASVSLDVTDQDRLFKWGVVLDGPQGTNFWVSWPKIHIRSKADRSGWITLLGYSGRPANP